MGEFLNKIVQLNLIGTYSILLVLILRLLLRRISNRSVYALWMVAFLMLVLPIGIPGGVSLIPRALTQIAWNNGLTVVNQEVNIAETTFTKNINDSQDKFDRNLMLVKNPHMENTKPDVPVITNTEFEETSVFPWVKYVCIVWLSGFLFLTIRELIRSMKLHRYTSRQEIIKIDFKRRIVRLKGPNSPFVFGIIQPTIYLADNMTAEESDYILTHEEYHRKRRDPLIKTVVMLITFVYWYNPFVWMGYHFFSIDMELSCDEAVLNRFDGKIKKEYASSLLKYGALENRYILSVLTFGEPNLKSRITNVLHYKKKNMFFTILAIAIVACVALGLFFRPMPKGNDTSSGTSAVVETEEPEQADTETLSDTSLHERIDFADLDGNGQAEYAIISYSDDETAPDYDGRLQFFWNDQCIYDYYAPLRIMSVHEAGYIDLDQDGEKEVYLFFDSMVNSMPLEEYIVLKQRENSWEPLEMIHGETMLDNSFPITCIEGDSYKLILGCERTEQKLEFDMEPYWKNIMTETVPENEFANSLMSTIRSEKYNFQKDTPYGGPLAWGIWDLQAGNFEGQNCLIAGHGMAGTMDKYFPIGKLNVYFNYDKNGKVSILNLDFVPYNYGQELVGSWTIDEVKTKDSFQNKDFLQEQFGNEFRNNRMIFNSNGEMTSYIGNTTILPTCYYYYNTDQILLYETEPQIGKNNEALLTMLRLKESDSEMISMEVEGETLYWKRLEQEQSEITYWPEGNLIQIPAQREIRGDYSVLIPTENWDSVFVTKIGTYNADCWEYNNNPAVRFCVIPLDHIKNKEALQIMKKEFTDYTFENQNEYSADYLAEGVSKNGQNRIQILIQRWYRTYAIISLFPTEYEEGVGSQLWSMANSFAGEKIVDAQSAFSYSDLKDEIFVFCSGAGGWSTDMTIEPDGSFHGIYEDYDMGGTTLPGGIVYQCDFWGTLSEPVRIDDWTWKAKVRSLAQKKKSGTKEIKNQTQYIYSDPHGFDEVDEVFFYLPGSPTKELPQEFMDWANGPLTDSQKGRDQLNGYGMYNVNAKEGFISFPKNYWHPNEP